MRRWLALARSGDDWRREGRRSFGRDRGDRRGLAADFLRVDLDRPEFTPSHVLMWELVRYGNRDQIDAVFTGGQLRLWRGWPVDWDAQALLAEVRGDTAAAIAKAPIQRIHPVSQTHRSLGHYQ